MTPKRDECETPLVSVVMPVFNAGPYLARAIKSVLGQSFRNFELIAVDDGSSDGSWDILASFEDTRIRRYRHAKNRGISETRNHGMAVARGRYIAVMDADDICLPDRLVRQFRFMEQHPRIVGCGMQVITLSVDGERRRCRLPTKAGEVSAALLFENAIAHPTLMLRAAVLRQHALNYDPAVRRAGDYALLTKLARLGPLINLGKAGVLYNQHDSGKAEDWLTDTRRTAARIRAEQAAQLGFSGRGQDAQLHEFIADGGRSGDVHSVDQVAHWMARAALANRRAQVWESDALNCVLRVRFFSLCRNMDWSLSAIWGALHTEQLFGGGVRRVRLMLLFGLKQAFRRLVCRLNVRVRQTDVYQERGPDR